MKKIIVLTGNELRHIFFRTILSHDSRFKIVASFCESTEKSLENRVINNENSTELELFHVRARTQSEIDFFGNIVKRLDDQSCPHLIKKGEINNEEIVNKIVMLKPDIIICYGSSIIKSKLLTVFKKSFLNVHLGLSPYYKGSGTNVWPIINNEFDMIGATFMYINEEVDSGEIIHQIRADILLGDSPHSIGNRLIMKMTNIYCDIIANYTHLSKEKKPVSKGKVYYQKDFNAIACERLYKNMSNDKILNYIKNKDKKLPYIVNNLIFRND